ncbi:S46 family peptidase [Segatella bryantii]|uniref:S46 family peptidase n=1 Tax=Segatella bryantii TaxID=77095 RepID=UPI000943EBDC|nr:S46 family peptidase [Segatella bryantii]
MKKGLTMSLLVAASIPAVHADEGMWTLYNLPQQVYETMQAEGFTMPYNDLYNSKNSLKNAVVNFSGFCSGVVVSPDGLVFTNHHCGFEAIRSHSTVEHDYMLNGFVANSYAEELPNKDMFVSFMKEQKDITDYINAQHIDKLNSDQKALLIDSLQNAMTDSIKKIDSTLHIDIDAFYEGNKWYATTYQDFTDLRLVFTVPKSMGKFGGETDNWMWPRQTCDFSVFRIYADPKTNGPAAYSKDNVPYKPERWAQVSLQGYQDKDYAMTIGYPGSTSRYLSSYGIQERRNSLNTPMAQVRGVKQEVMQKHMRADEGVRIKYDSKFAHSANYWKNSLGMNKCIDSIGLINQKQIFEAKIRAWQDTAKDLEHKVDFDLLARLYKKRMEISYVLTNWSESFSRRSDVEFSIRALKLNNGMEVKGPKDNAKKQYFQFEDNSNDWDAPLDKEVLATLLKNYREHVNSKYLPKFYQTIDKKFGGNYTEYVDFLYNKSIIMKKDAKIYFNSKSYKKDPGVIYGEDLMDIREDLREGIGLLNDSIDEQEKYLCAAKIRMEQDLPHYSDANFTMRLSYGQVSSFDLGGKDSGYYTVAESIVEKMKKGEKIFDYQAEPIMQQLMSEKDFGQYQDKKTGKMQLCFLTNNDITGGNSGSPMFNGKGELIGLAFDGNWDSLSSDINFDSRLARCIGVDIRYVLYMIDKWGHADRLIKEINAK